HLEVTMRPFCERLEISNIRVVKRIERLAVILREALAGHDNKVLEEAYKVLTLMGWSVYAEGAAPLEFIEKRGVWEGMREEDGRPPDEVKWGAMLDRYGFRYTSEFDKLVRDGVKRGYFDIDRLSAEAGTLTAALASQARLDAFSRAWRLY